MSKKLEYPLWSEDRVIHQIDDTHFVELELRDGGSGVITLIEILDETQIRNSFRNYFDVAMMTDENFRLQLEHFLKDSTNRGMHHLFDDDRIVIQIVGMKIILEQYKAERICHGELHCGKIYEHSSHYHMEGPNGYLCEGWSND